MKDFSHISLELDEDKKLVYTAMSKHYFYYRMFISKFVLDNGFVPINPFMSFDYFMAGMVDKDKIRNANNNLVMKSDELWVFGPVSDGVLAEIKIAKEIGKPIKYFGIKKPHEIVPIEKEEVILEENISEFKKDL